MQQKKLNNNLAKLVTILNDSNFHDGNDIGKTLGITRSAIWKIIKKLNNYGVVIHSNKNKGYALPEPLILLDAEKIQSKLDSAIKSLVTLAVFETLESTNDYLKKLPQKKHLAICLAEQQTRGKGRFSRDWHSPFAKNIYFSCHYQFRKDISELAGLSLVVGLAIINTLVVQGLTDQLFIKWPNDILWDEKKLAGTLIEVSAETHGLCEVIIGIGLNINMVAAEANDITQPWSSIRQILNKQMDRNNIVAALINNLVDYIMRFETHGLAHFMQEWQSYDYLLEKPVRLLKGTEPITGKGLGINPQGHLLLQLTTGSIQTFSAGEVSIMKD